MKKRRVVKVDDAKVLGVSYRETGPIRDDYGLAVFFSRRGCVGRRLQAGARDKRVLDEARKMAGERGKIIHSGGIWRWTIGAERECKEVLEAILPFAQGRYREKVVKGLRAISPEWWEQEDKKYREEIERVMREFPDSWVERVDEIPRPGS